MKLLRKMGSLSKKINSKFLAHKLFISCIFFKEGISFDGSFSMSGPINIVCTDNGIIKIGKNVSFGCNVKVVAQSGEVYIGDDTHVGDGTLIVAKDNIYIGNNVLIAEYVVIRDQDHDTDSDPINSSGFKTAPIRIDNNVWLAAKSTVLKGVHIGEGAVVAAHALVNKSVVSRTIVAGVPAKQVSIR